MEGNSKSKYSLPDDSFQVIIGEPIGRPSKAQEPAALAYADSLRSPHTRGPHILVRPKPQKQQLQNRPHPSVPLFLPSSLSPPTPTVVGQNPAPHTKRNGNFPVSTKLNHSFQFQLHVFSASVVRIQLTTFVTLHLPIFMFDPKTCDAHLSR